MRLGWRLIIFFGLVLAVCGVETYALIAVHVPIFSGGDITASGMLVQEIVLLSASIAATANLAMLEGRKFGDYGLPVATAFGLRFWQGLVWGLAMISAMIFLIHLLGGLSFSGVALRVPAACGRC